jgi:hypothetical protein
MTRFTQNSGYVNYKRMASGAEPLPSAVPHDDEHIAMMEVTQARMALSSAIEAFERAGYGSHVTNPLRDALRFVEFSISEVKS